MNEPKGKGKRRDMEYTQPLRPVDPNHHRAHLEMTVHVKQGIVETILVCECGQRKVMSQHQVADFHVVPAEEPKPT